MAVPRRDYHLDILLDADDIIGVSAPQVRVKVCQWPGGVFVVVEKYELKLES
jgi:hypothetical protein